MAKEHSEIAWLRSALVNLERGAVMPDGLVDRVVDHVREHADAEVGPPSVRRWRAPLVAATLVAALAVVITVTTTPGPKGRHSTANTASTDGWLTYASPRATFQVKYPPTWRPYPAEYVGTFTDGIIYFSSQPVPSPCVTSHGGAEIRCGTPVFPLDAGGVLVGWTQTEGFPPGVSAIKGQPGRITTIDGHQATIAMSRPRSDTACERSNGTRLVEIAIGQARASVINMTACLSGTAAQLQSQTRNVLASARSVQLGN